MHKVFAAIFFSFLITEPARSNEIIELDVVLGDGVVGGRDYFESVASEMNGLLQASDSDRCRALTVKLDLLGRFPPGIISIDPLEVESSRLSYIDTAVGGGANVLIVRSLSVCDTLRSSQIAGCAGPTTALVAESLKDARQDATIWLHEIGHSFNLSWALLGNSYPHEDKPERLMYKEVSSVGEVTETECMEFAKRHAHFDPDPAALLLAENLTLVDNGAGGVPLDEGGVVQLLTTLDEVVFRPWIHGVPIPQLDLLAQDPEFLDSLRRNMLDRSKVRYWSNIATVLGYYGDISDYDFLKSFLKRKVVVADMDASFYGSSKAVAIYSLGLLSARFQIETQDLLQVIIASSARGGTRDATTTLNEAASVDITGLPELDRQPVEREILYSAVKALAISDAARGGDGSAVFEAVLDPLSDSPLADVPVCNNNEGSRICLQSRLTSGDILDVDPAFLESLPSLMKDVRESGIEGFLRQ